MKGIDRFLLVLDDFESVTPVLGEMLGKYLLKRLSEVPFPVLVVIAGRDDLYDSLPATANMLKPYVKGRIRLKPFSRAEALLYLQNAGYGSSEAGELYEECLGYPYVLSLLVDFKRNQRERPALFYQQFYDRTTQWMTTPEREWLIELLYLDEVNESSVEAMMPDSNPKRIMEWFGREASVRDTDYRCFRVAPYIRKMLLQYHRNLVGPAKQRQFEERGQAALAKASQ